MDDRRCASETGCDRLTPAELERVCGGYRLYGVYVKSYQISGSSNEDCIEA